MGFAVYSMMYSIEDRRHAEWIDKYKEFGGGSSLELRWLLRDFVLALQDVNNKPISSKEYLENALRDRSNAVYRQKDTREAREKLCSLFKQRTCMTLPSPVIEEDLLQDLPNLQWEDLRKVFRDQFELIRDSIFRDASANRGSEGPLSRPSGRLLADLVLKFSE